MARGGEPRELFRGVTWKKQFMKTVDTAQRDPLVAAQNRFRLRVVAESDHRVAVGFARHLHQALAELAPAIFGQQDEIYDPERAPLFFSDFKLNGNSRHLTGDRVSVLNNPQRDTVRPGIWILQEVPLPEGGIVLDRLICISHPQEGKERILVGNLELLDLNVA